MISKQIPDAGGLPWVGQMPQMTQDPLQFLLGLARTHGPIARFTMFGKSFVLVSDSEYVREVLVTKANLFPKSSRDLAIMGPLLGYGLLTTNGAQHKKLRKLAQPAFHAKRITTYADAMTDLAISLTDEWRNGETRDINVEMLQLTMYIVSKTLFDTDRSAMSGMADQIGHAIHQLQEVADFDFTWYDGAQRPPAHVIAAVGTAENVPSTGSVVIGTTGTLAIPHGGGLPKIYRDGVLSTEVIEAVEAGHHHKNFADAIRGDIPGKPLTNFDYSGPMTEAVLLGTVAMRLPGETLKWDEAAGTFVGSDAANALIHEKYREGWEVKGI